MQIGQAVELYSINENDTITNEQSEMAYNLYMSLNNKPNFVSGPNKVGPPFTDNSNPRNFEPLSPKLFKEPARIFYLTRWIIIMLPFIELFSSDVAKLPVSRANSDKDFLTELEGRLLEYLKKVKAILDLIPQSINIIQKRDFENIEGLCNKIISSLEEYLKGYPDKAFNELCIGLDSYLKNGNYLKNVLDTGESHYRTLYKMRVGSNHIYSADEMFHIPFDKRGLVKTNRYSIPGLHCHMAINGCFFFSSEKCK